MTECNNSDSGTISNRQTDTSKTINNLITTDATSTDTTLQTQTSQTKLSVLILPPYDLIANGGISPDIQTFLETEISKDTSLSLIKFPYKQLMNVPYQNVFDKKYCKPITDKIKTDIIVMSKLDNVSRTGQMPTDKWNFQIRIYNPSTDRQTNSTVKADNITDNEIKSIIASRQNDLTTEIKNNR